MNSSRFIGQGHLGHLEPFQGHLLTSQVKFDFSGHFELSGELYATWLYFTAP